LRTRALYLRTRLRRDTDAGPGRPPVRSPAASGQRRIGSEAAVTVSPPRGRPGCRAACRVCRPPHQQARPCGWADRTPGTAASQARRVIRLETAGGAGCAGPVLRGVVEAALKRQDGGDLLVVGSTQLVPTPVGHDLVDQLQLMIDPVVVWGESASSRRTARC